MLSFIKQTPLMYTKEEFIFIDDLLQRALNNDFTYSKLAYDNTFNFDLYNRLFSDINKEPYKLIELYEDNFQITTLGRKVSNNGFEEYLNQLDNEKETDNKIKSLTLDDLEKSDKRSKRAFIVSIVAVVVAIIIPLLIYIITKPEITDDGKDNPNNTEIKGTIGAEINHSQTPSDFINTTSIKVLSDTSINSNHNSNILNDSLPNH